VRPSRKHEAADYERRLDQALRRIVDLEQQLERRELRDPLTSLTTLEPFSRRLDAEISRSRRHNRQLSIGVIDIDAFRAVNARHGRAAGDAVLVRTARTIAAELRASDVACRAGADDFVIMLPETAPADATACLERILLALQGAGGELAVDSINASAGVASLAAGMSGDALVAEAGGALDRARSRGGGRVEAMNAEPATGDDPDVEAAAAQQEVIAGLAEALLERDRYTGEHSESVVQLVDSVARGLGLKEAEAAHIRAAALLHDIGKVAIPDDILNKNGPLDDDEWKVMRDHPVIGERILRAVPGMGPVARIVRHEHERWDGGGYPDGLIGEAIPIGSRIILACDAYHAMTSDRPYRKAMPHAEAIRELSDCSGKQFDPEVTKMLIGKLYGDRMVGSAKHAALQA
jgi:diguanylate cyclase (GGDEF)-like protein/putative nucleotidyltransferase with HDIG domain